jgi:hypothetical protein
MHNAHNPTHNCNISQKKLYFNPVRSASWIIRKSTCPYFWIYIYKRRVGSAARCEPLCRCYGFPGRYFYLVEVEVVVIKAKWF